MGYITEKETLDLITANNLSLIENSRLTTELVDKGVIFADNNTEEEYLDRSQTNYEAVYREILNISPSQELFIDYVKKIKPPQTLEWKNLFVQYLSGNKFAFNRLFEMYLRIAVKMALDFSKSYNLELDDCIQESAIALIQAIRKFDITENDNFIGNITLRIKNSLERAKDNNYKLIRFPVHFLERVKTVENSITELYQALERMPTYEEIATYAKCSIETVEIVVTLTEQNCLEEFLTIDKDGFVEYTLEDKSLIPIDTIQSKNENKSMLDKLLNILTEREQKVIQLRFGLIDGREYTLEEIGINLDLTRERIRQIERKAFSRIRKYLALRKSGQLTLWDF